LVKFSEGRLVIATTVPKLPLLQFDSWSYFRVMNRDNCIVLFDVDGTLTLPRKKASEDMLNVLKELRKRFSIGVVGGSDLEKIKEQLTPTILNDFDYVFAENGTVAYKNGTLISESSVKDYLGYQDLNRFNRYVMKYLSELDIPITTGTFIEHRRGLINVCPIGRNCSQTERDDFEAFDKQHKIRETMVAILREKFADLKLQFSIGGQISFDVFPVGWNKTFCLQYVNFPNIFFFGDKTEPGGNDYEIFTDPRVKGTSVKSPDDTKKFLGEIFS